MFSKVGQSGTANRSPIRRYAEMFNRALAVQAGQTSNSCFSSHETRKQRTSSRESRCKVASQ
jgi:hypothetical protein